MTGGVNTVPDLPRYNIMSHGAYGMLHQNRLDTTDTSTAVQTLDSRLRGMCTRTKAQGIMVFTVSFAIDADPDISSSRRTELANLMRNRASVDPQTNQAYDYNAANGDSLEDAFRNIGGHLSNRGSPGRPCRRPRLTAS